MTSLAHALASHVPVLLDGAMGTELIGRGLRPEVEPTHAWNLSRPQVVRAIHQAYVAAGARGLLTNTFAVPLDEDEARRTAAMMAGIELARQAVGPDGLVLGSLGPPAGGTVAERIERLAACVRALAAAPALDGILLETQHEPPVVGGVLDAILDEALPRPLLVSFAFGKESSAPPRLPGPDRRWTPVEVARFITAAGPVVAALGVNCGRGLDLDDVVGIVRGYRSATDLPILARPNAGPGGAGEGVLAPEALAAALPRLVNAGATLIGGCCGTTPAHVAALGRALEALPPAPAEKPARGWSGRSPPV
jgi:5-methyltetrahydrofolate--homocysteine methyltransferase